MKIKLKDKFRPAQKYILQTCLRWGTFGAYNNTTYYVTAISDLVMIWAEGEDAIDHLQDEQHDLWWSAFGSQKSFYACVKMHLGRCLNDCCRYSRLVKWQAQMLPAELYLWTSNVAFIKTFKMNITFQQS